MKTYCVKIKGITPLLHHRMTEEDLFKLLGAKSSRKKNKEERTPREIAEMHAYKIGEKFVIPSGYLSGAFSHVASDYKQSNSKRSIKAIAGGVFRPQEEFIELWENDENHIKDFEVDIRKATNHKAGAVAVCRPRFDKWQANFTVQVDTDLLPQEVAHQILIDAGKRAGIGSFRVSNKGWFGQFQVTEWLENMK